MKKTKRDFYNEIKNIEGVSEEIKAFCDAELALLDKKNSNRKPNKEQKANEGYKAQILEILADTTDAKNGMTASEVHKAMKYEGEPQVQKTSALLAQLAKAGDIVRDTAGKKTVFYIAIVEDDVDDEEDAVQALDGEITY